MRLAHRFNWHYAPPQPQIEIEDRLSPVHWCKWCGLRARAHGSEAQHAMETVRRAMMRLDLIWPNELVSQTDFDFCVSFLAPGMDDSQLAEKIRPYYIHDAIQESVAI